MAGRASATFEQQLQALWERSRVLMGCLDWQSTVMLLPPALQEAATLAPRSIDGDASSGGGGPWLSPWPGALPRT